MLRRKLHEMHATLSSLEQIRHDADGGLQSTMKPSVPPGMMETATEFLESLRPIVAIESAFQMLGSAMGAIKLLILS